jgi:hypothetical protein
LIYWNSCWLFLHVLKKSNLPQMDALDNCHMYITSGYSWWSDTIRPCLQACVAAFGFQDLGFRTSIFDFQDLDFRTSINGHCISLSGPRFQDLDIWISGPMFQDLDIWILGPRCQAYDTSPKLCFSNWAWQFWRICLHPIFLLS